MKISRVEAHALANIPIQPPPFRKQPSVEKAILLEIEAADGTLGWSMAGNTHPSIVGFINTYVRPVLIGENPLRIESIWARMHREFSARQLGRFFTAVLSMIDIALWDIKGKALGQPVHHLLGGAYDKIPVYITHGAAYGDAPPYDIEELAAEAAHLVKLGNRFLKNTVGRQAFPDPVDDYRRMRAIREAVGPEIKLAMDGNDRMSVAEAAKLCRLTTDLDISFLEEPVFDNDPRLLAELRSQVSIPIAAAQNHKFSARDLLLAGAVDIIQPNVIIDGGYTGAAKIAALADSLKIPIGHGNGGGPHNVALHAALPNGRIVEYHFHKWMLYNALFESVPQPENGYLSVPQKPGLGLDPKPGVVKEYKVDPETLGSKPALVSGSWLGH